MPSIKRLHDCCLSAMDHKKPLAITFVKCEQKLLHCTTPRLGNGHSHMTAESVSIITFRFLTATLLCTNLYFTPR